MNKPVEKEALQGAEGVAPVTGLELMRQPFPDHQISKLPKETKAQADQRKAEQDKGNWPSRCKVCGGLHHERAVHLDYVGHAALTDRLLDADPLWSWEPMATVEDGSPRFDGVGGLWIKLTVCGVTRLGYGHAGDKKGGDAVKEIIGDALRNAAMRFGAALDLWHKGDLHAPEESGDLPSAEQAAIAVLRTYADNPDEFKRLWGVNKDSWKKLLEPAAYARVVAVMQEIGGKFKAAPPPQPRAEDLIPNDEIPF